MPPTFSVVMATLDRPALAAEALASLVAQDYEDFECIVVDDGGRSPVPMPDDRRFRLIRHPRTLGLPSALNSGIDAAEGDHVTFLDDDDTFTPDRLSMALPRLQSAPVVLCWAAADGPPDIVNRTLEGMVLDTILDIAAPPKGAATIARHRLLRFDPRYLALEDLEWWLRTAAEHRVTTVARVGYRIHRRTPPLASNGPAARAYFGQMLLHERADYFGTHRRAAALRWRRVGGIALQQGDTALARRALSRALVLDPRPDTVWPLVRSVAPRRTTLPTFAP
jgi:glycosyltransferase involved in cell wall biosynthesis